jgi:putative ABC transport system ATP-binding protein
MPGEEPRVRAPAFRLRGVTKTYATGAGSVRALDGVDLDLFPGEFVVLLGPSGSGKSTLLNILGGLDAPTSGSVCFHDHDLAGDAEAPRTAYRREHVGFVFQFYNLLPALTALENVAVVAEIAADPMAPEEALELVGLADRAGHFPAELSGGEQQRVAVARAIVKRPAVLLCDEPTGALDVRTGVVVLEAIARVAAAVGAITVLITHNAGIAAMADRVLSMSDGRIVAERANAGRAPAASLRW